MAARRKRPERTRAERDFISEAEEILDSLRGDLLDLEDQRGRGPDAEVDPEVVNRAFRAAHSLKGLAGMVGYDRVGDLAHRLEDALDRLRMGRIGFESPVFAAIEAAVVLCGELIASTGAPPESDAARVADVIALLDRSLSGEPESTDAGEPELDLDPAMLRALTEYEEHRLQENLRKGRHVSLVETNLDLASFEEGLAELTGAIREVGEVLSTLPSPGDSSESQIRFSLLAATTVSVERLVERLDFPDTQVRSVREGVEAVAGTARGTAEAAIPVAADPAADAEVESLKSVSETVRVDIRKLDELMTLVGELVIQRNAISAIADRMVLDPATQRAGRDLTKIHKLLDRKLKELQAGVLDVRMVPLRQVFQKLSRVARRLGRDLDKSMHLDFAGADTELDKLIVEELVDPLMHLVRNAIDHGLETPDQRRAAGKPPEGRIAIEASQRGNHVVISVSDDGSGIDPAVVRERAEAAGLLAHDTVATESEIFSLLFEPGFSTRDVVSETSGRGVGLDVVRSNVTSLGGLVDLASRPGHGSTTTLTLPITLAIVQALIVEVGEQRFAIPLNSVLETLFVRQSEVQHSEGEELLNLRGEPLMIRRLASEFGIPSRKDHDDVCAVVLGLGDLRMGLLVDALLGQQDAVIKPIQGPVQRIRGIAGATELGDGSATLVLDVASFVEDATRRKDSV